MTWNPILPPARLNSRITGPVVLTVSKETLRRKQTAMLIAVRPEMLEGGLSWWSVDKRVSVAVGQGEHAGMLRITPGGFWRIAGKGNPQAGLVSVLRLPVPDGAPKEGCKKLPLEYDYAEEWLEVTLPDWARPTAAKAFTVVQPFSISTRVPDPAVALQAARGGRVR